MFRSQLNSKIGNLLNYLSTSIPELSMTKALKLMYLIDETSYMRTGVPVTWLDYKVWEMGPVAEELYNELKYDQRLIQNGEQLSLEEFISTEKRVNAEGQLEQIIIVPKGSYNLGEFSEFESELIENIVDKFGTFTAKQLIQLLHEKDTLWHKSVTENNLLLNFKLYGKKSNHTIDFAELIKENPVLQMQAQSAFESMLFQEEMNNL